MPLNDNVYVLTTYRTAENTYAFALESSSMSWDASMTDAESFKDGLAFIVGELSKEGEVILRRSEPAVPEELIPEAYR